MIETRMRENMQKADYAYIAGWNMPGCLSEVEPAIFDNETDAIRYLSDAVDRFWDEDYQGLFWHTSGEGRGFAADNRWMDLHSSLPYETAPFNIQNGDGSLTFWVAIVPRSTVPTYDREGN